MRHRERAQVDRFWRFSLAFYARPGVATALLRLQDGAGLDVNLILWALWAGAVAGRALTLTQLAEAQAVSSELRDTVVGPLRGLRRALKSSPDRQVQALRRQVAGLELAAERRVQQGLAALLECGSIEIGSRTRLRTARENLSLYLGCEYIESSEAKALHRALAAFLQR